MVISWVFYPVHYPTEGPAKKAWPVKARRHNLDEANVWKNLNITAMLKLSHPHSQLEVLYYLY